MVYLALQLALPSPYVQMTDIEAEDYYNEMLCTTAKNVQRNYVSHTAFTALNNAGISFCLLKGESLAKLYHDANFRISADTDILVSEDNAEKAARIMEKLGYTVAEKFKTSHHICCTHPVGGLFEIHLHLYDELFEDTWFDNKIKNEEPFHNIMLDDSLRVSALGITDGFIFTALHFIKHFLSHGAGVRQMMDTLLYCKEYFHQINWDRYHALMKHLKYNQFMDCIFQIGTEYCGLKNCFPTYNPVDKSLLLRILEDMENGGVFGQEQKERGYFYYRYTEARFKTFKPDQDYNRYIKEWAKEPLLKKVFPSRKALHKQYSYVQKSLILLPVAWTHRACKLSLRFITKNKKLIDHKQIPRPDNTVVEKRMELIKDLKMI